MLDGDKHQGKIRTEDEGAEGGAVLEGCSGKAVYGFVLWSAEDVEIVPNKTVTPIHLSQLGVTSILFLLYLVEFEFT